jgi:hypothetical protein
VKDLACVQLCVLRAGASSLTGCRVVAIHCDWCGCLGGEDGARTAGGFGPGLCRGDTCCRERESSKKFNPVGTTGVLGMSCTLGDVAGVAGSGSVSRATLGGAAGVT